MPTFKQQLVLSLALLISFPCFDRLESEFAYNNIRNSIDLAVEALYFLCGRSIMLARLCIASAFISFSCLRQHNPSRSRAPLCYQWQQCSRLQPQRSGSRLQHQLTFSQCSEICSVKQGQPHQHELQVLFNDSDRRGSSSTRGLRVRDSFSLSIIRSFGRSPFTPCIDSDDGAISAAATSATVASFCFYF